MKQILEDGALEVEAEPIQQLTRQWAALSLEEAAGAFRDTFTEASILPHEDVLGEARRLSESLGFQVPLAFMAANEEWSVYAIGPRWVAVNTDMGEWVSFADLLTSDFERMGIPLPDGVVG